MANLSYTGALTYDEQNKIALVEYKVCNHGDYFIYVFPDMDEAMRDGANNNHMIELGHNGYTRKALEKKKAFLGVYIIQDE